MEKSFMKRRPKKNNLMVDINITPFTDVVLVLLIIFIVATPFIYQNKISINLPKANQEKNLEKPRKIIVSITENGEVYIDNKKYLLSIDYNIIKAKILSSVGNGENANVIINADKNCKYDYVMTIISAAKELNIHRIMLGAEAKK
jgi:biopolymer transport protein ExbD